MAWDSWEGSPACVQLAILLDEPRCFPVSKRGTFCLKASCHRNRNQMSKSHFVLEHERSTSALDCMASFGRAALKEGPCRVWEQGTWNDILSKGSGRPTLCMHPTKSSLFDTRHSKTSVPIRVMMRILATTYGLSVTSMPILDRRLPIGPMENGMTYMVRPEGYNHLITDRIK